MPNASPERELPPHDEVPGVVEGALEDREERERIAKGNK